MTAIQQFGKYALLGRLAVGGMAEVFRAKLLGEAGFQRTVALKRILPQLNEDDEFIRMFIDEARIAGRLSHGNIVQTIELGRFDGSYYIAMELVDGMDLSTFINASHQRGLPPSVPLACFAIAEACRGLAYAHEANDDDGNPLGIIHRDISPQNVLLSINGDVKISDFGIAKAMDRASQTSAGVIKGKGGYMPPEQFDGDALDHRADLYAMGVVFYELLTFEHLHNFPMAHDYAMRLRRTPPPQPSRANPEVDTQLDAIVQRCVTPDPNDRFPDAGTLERQIMRYLHGKLGGFSQSDLAHYLRKHLPDVRQDSAQSDDSMPRTMFQSGLMDKMEVLFAQEPSPERKASARKKSDVRAAPAPAAPSAVRGPQAGARARPVADAVSRSTGEAAPRRTNLPAARQRGDAAPMRKTPAPRPHPPAATADNARTQLLDVTEAVRISATMVGMFPDEQATTLSTPEAVAAVRESLASTRLDMQAFDDGPADGDATVLGAPAFLDEMRQELARRPIEEPSDDQDAFAPETSDVREAFDDVEEPDAPRHDDPLSDPVIAAILAADENAAPDVKERADDIWGAPETRAESEMYPTLDMVLPAKAHAAKRAAEESARTMMVDQPDLDAPDDDDAGDALDDVARDALAGFAEEHEAQDAQPSLGGDDEPEFDLAPGEEPPAPGRDPLDDLLEPEPDVTAAQARKPEKNARPQAPARTTPPPAVKPPPPSSTTPRPAPPSKPVTKTPPPAATTPPRATRPAPPAAPDELLSPKAITPPVRTHKVGNEIGKLLLAIPDGCAVLVNGCAAGAGSVLLTGMDPAARLPVEVTHPGYQTWKSMVSLGGKPSGQVKVELRRAKA